MSAHPAEKDAAEPVRVEHDEYRVTGIPLARWFDRREIDWTRSLDEASRVFRASRGPNVRLERRHVVTTTWPAEVYLTRREYDQWPGVTPPGSPTPSPDPRTEAAPGGGS